MDNPQANLVTIPGYPLYLASESGRIYSKRSKKYLKPIKTRDGYHVVNPCYGGKFKKVGVHRLVALAFLPNPDNYPIVHHKDDNKANNRLNNLEWCSYSHNNREDYRLKGSSRNKGRGNTNQWSGFVTEEMRVKANQLRASGMSTPKIGALLGISATTAWKIVQGASTTREPFKPKVTLEIVKGVMENPDKVSQAKLAEKYGVSQPTISKISRGLIGCK